MIIEEYKEKEFHIDEKLWDTLLANFRKNLALFKKSHSQNRVVLFTVLGPIDLAKFLYEMLSETHMLDTVTWPLEVDMEWIDNHFKNFTCEVVIVDEQEREMGDGDIVVYGEFMYEERNW